MIRLGHLTYLSDNIMNQIKQFLILSILIGYSIQCYAQSFSIFRDDSEISTDRGSHIESYNDIIYTMNGLYCEDGINNGCFILMAYNKDGIILWERRIDFLLPGLQRFTIKDDTITTFTQEYRGIDSTRWMDGIQYSTSGDSLRTTTTELLDDGSRYWLIGVTSDANSYYAYGQKIFPRENQSDSVVGSLMVYDHDLQLDTIYEYYKANFSTMYSVRRGPDDRLYSLGNFAFDHIQDSFDILRLDEDTHQFEVLKSEANVLSYTDPDLKFSPDGVHLYSMIKDSGNIGTNNNEPDLSNDNNKDGGIKKQTLDGEWVWRRGFGKRSGADGAPSYRVYGTTVAGNGDVILCGRYDVYYDFAPKKYGAWLARVDSDGDVLWSRSYPLINNAGEYRENAEFFGVVELDDGNIVATGWADQWDSESTDKDFWLFKVGPDGCYDGAECLDVMVNDSTSLDLLTSTQPLIIETLPLQISPNPASDHIQLTLPEVLEGYLTIKSINGELYYEESSLLPMQKHVDVGHFPAGVYLVEVLTSDLRRYVERVVVH